MAVGDPWIFTAASGNIEAANTNSFQFGPGSVPGTPTFIGGGPLFTPVDPCVAGHVAETSEWTTICRVCGVRIELPATETQVGFTRIAELLGLVMGFDDETCLLPEFDMGEMLAKFNALRDALHEEEFRLRQARKNLELAGRILQHKARKTVE